MREMTFCENCQQSGGFHVRIQKIEERNTIALILVCPQCETAYDLGLDFGEPE
jgi:protein-arginine kinase activator protein McsA